MKQKKISIIIPVYNKEKYVATTIESITKQTYNNLEIIIINDGSTDSSKKICEEKVKGDNRIIFVDSKNKGAGVARNIGLSMATGDLISFIDADDYIIPKYYEILISLLEENNADIAECRFRRVNNMLEKLKEDTKPHIQVFSNEEKLMQLYGEDNTLHINTVIMCNKIFKKELFAGGICYPENRIIDDEFIIYRLLYNSNKIVVTTQTMYGYVQSAGSTMRGEFAKQRVYDALEVYDRVYKFFRNKKFEHLEEHILLTCLKNGVELIEKTIKSNIQDKEIIINCIKQEVENKWYILFKDYHTHEIFQRCEKVYQKFFEIYNKKIK